MIFFSFWVDIWEMTTENVITVGGEQEGIRQPSGTTICMFYLFLQCQGHSIVWPISLAC